MEFLKKMIRYIFRRVDEFFVVGISRFKYFIQGKYFRSDEGQYKEFRADLTLLSSKYRMEGISGFYRVKNEEQLLGMSVQNYLPHLDEIIIVYNDCTDRTPEIAEELARRYPDKIKAYRYIPHVETSSSLGHRVTPSWSVHSMVNYYNFALSKTTRKIAVKIDADEIPILPQFIEVVNNIREKGLDAVAYFYGVNIYMEDGNVFINAKKPFMAGIDHWFFPVSRKTYFIHNKDCESLSYPIRMRLNRRRLGMLFYHLKGVKFDRGLSNFKNQAYIPKDAQIENEKMANPDLVSWEEGVSRWPDMLAHVIKPSLPSDVLKNKLK